MGLFDDVLGDDAPSQSSGLFDDVLSPKPDSAGVAEFKRRGSDALVSLGKGAIAVPEALVGLADIPTGGAIGKLAEEHGFKPKEWKANIDSKYSPEQQKANQAVRSADGFLPTLSAAVQNPSTIINSVIESAPSTVAGGAIGRLATAGRAAPVIAGSIGEGALSAGSTAEQIRQDDPNGALTPQQSAIAAGSGALTGLITVAGGRVAQKLGIHDVDTVMAGGGIQQAATKGLARRVGEGAASEGVEELLQSGQEQAAQNLAQGKPIMEGVGNAAATGMLAGHVMGGAANVPGPLTAAASLATPEDPTKTMPYKTTEAAQARADAMTTQYGVPFEVTPHPTVGGSFAVTPLEVDDESGTTGKPAAAKAGMGADVPAGDIGAPAVAAGAGSGDAAGTGAVGEGQAAAAAADMDRPAAGADGAGPEVGTPPVARGPLEAAAQLAPAAQAPATITPLASAAPVDASVDTPVDTATLPPTNIGAAKVDPDNPRLLTEHDIAAHQAASSSLNDSKETPSMIDANNRKLGRSQWNGMKLAWENGNGTVREGVDEDGKPWKTLMPHNYGFIENTEAADSTPDKKAGLDISMGPNPDSNLVVIVNQTKKDGSFDEHKIQAGFNTPEEARQAYLDSYQAGWNGGNDMRVTTVEGLQKWKDQGDTKAPFEDGPALATVPSSPPAAGAAPTSGSSTAPALTESQPGSASGPLPAQPTTGFAAQDSAALHSPAVQNPSPAAARAGLLSDVGASDGSLRSPDKETDANITSDLGVNTTKSSVNSVEKLQNQANSLRQIISNVQQGAPQRAAMEAKLGELTSQIAALTPKTPSPAVQAAVTDGVIPDAPATAPGLFMSRVQAAKYAVDHGLAADPVDTDSGVVLQPRSQRASPQQAKIATTKVAQLNKGLVRDGYQPVTPVLDASSPDMAIAQSVAKVAFGVDVTPVKGSTDFDGVREGNNVFVSTDSVNPVLAVTGHEVYHFYQDSPVGKAIRAIAREHLRPGQIPLRQDLEDAAQRQSLGENAPGFVPTSADYAEHELVADLHGAMWMDSKFWSAMAQKDESLFRKVAYKFMEYATKAVSVARASSFNADNIVRDVDAVREAIATAWAQHHKGAYNGGKGVKNEAAKGKAFARKDPPEAGEPAAAGVPERAVKNDSGQSEETVSRPYRRGTGVPRSVTVAGKSVTATRWEADPASAQQLAARGIPAPAYLELKGNNRAETFAAAITAAKAANPAGASVYAYPTADYANMKLFLTEDGKAGVAVKQDGDIVSLFNTPGGTRGIAYSALNVAIENGGLKLDAFDTVLPAIYAKAGFTPAARLKWDDSQAPNDWDKKTFDRFNHGEPDVVFMALDPARNGRDYVLGEGTLVSDYNEAVRLQNELADRGQHGKNESDQEGRDGGHRAGNLAGVRREAAVAIKPKQDDARTVVGIHYGKVGELGTLDGSKNGTGIPGSEQKRLKYSDDARIKRRVYFYPDTGTDALPTKEGGLGTHAYAAKLGNLYDFTKDPAGIMAATKDIRDQADRANTLESMVVNAGYDGYGNSHMIVVLDGNVPVTYLGDQKDNKQKDSSTQSDADKELVSRFKEQFAGKILDGDITEAQWLKMARQSMPRPQFSRKNTNTPEFKKWFGDSKVVDDKGQPLAVYHGTDQNFDTFRPRSAVPFKMAAQRWVRELIGKPTQAQERFPLDGTALWFAEQAAGGKLLDLYEAQAGTIWFTSSTDLASDYANSRRGNRMQQADDSRPNVMPVYLAIDKPVILDFATKSRDKRKIIHADGRVEVTDTLFKAERFGTALRIAATLARKEGADGFIIKGGDFPAKAEGFNRRSEDIYVAFDPKQVKSAIGNNGNFDPSDDRIQFSRKPTFYSSLQRAISDSIPRDKTGMVGIGQAKMWIAAKAKEGLFKPAEVEWSGINDYLDLQTGKVPVADLAAFVDSNGVKVNDVMKGGDQDSEERTQFIDNFVDKKREEHDASMDSEVESLMDNYDGGSYSVNEEEQSDGASLWIVKNNYLGDEIDTFDSEDAANERMYELNDEEYSEYEASVRNNMESFDEDAARAEANDAWAEDHGDNETQYERYVLPGGKNYRELLLTLPSTATSPSMKGWNASYVGGGTWEVNDSDGKFRGTTRADSNAQLSSVLSSWLDSPAGKTMKTMNRPGTFSSSHWDEPNILAHIRFNDRTDADGKKVLFIEELQSDWGQEGKKKGFKGSRDEQNMSELVAQYDEMRRERRMALREAQDMEGAGPRFIELMDKERELQGQMDKLQERMDGLRSTISSGVPRGPFVEKTEAWLGLGIKRMIRYAAENGYDKVAFVNGEQSAERYDLSKQVSTIDYVNNKDSTYGFSVRSMDGREVISKEVYDLQEIEDTVGKEIAQKIERGEGERQTGTGGWHRLSGLDLKVGGEGMKAFYDKIVPNVANDVLKKLGGGKIATTEIPVKKGKPTEYADYRAWTVAPDIQTLKQNGFTVTDAMKDAALQGQPQFSRKPPDWLATVPGMTPDIAEKVGLWTPPQTMKQRIESLKQDIGKKVVQGVFDQFAPIKELDFKSYMLARMAKSTDGGLEGVLLYGKVKLDSDGALTNDLSGGFIDMMKGLKGEQDRFFAWVAGNRAAQLKAEGRENLFTDTDISALRRANQGTLADGSSRPMLYANSLRELNAFSTSILDIAERAGTIDGAERATWEKDFYVPFYRVLDDDKVTGPRNLSGLTNQYAFKKLKGGTEGLNDLMQNTIMNWSHLLSSAMKNQAASSALKAAELVHAAHVIPDAQKGSVFVLDHGKKVHYFVDDPFLLDAVGSLSYSGMKGWGIDLATKAKRALSYGVTFSPSYRARNLIRDQLQAIAANPMSYNIASNLVKGFKYSAKNNPMYAQMITGGALIRMGSAYEDNRAGYLKKLIGGIDEGSILNSPEKIKTLFNKAVHAWQEVGDRAESVTRASIYEKALKDNKSHLEASYLARDSMDFGLQGSWPAVRLLTQTVPFMNARLQGIYKLGRAWNGDKKRFIAVTGAVTMATIAMMLANRDDDDWKRREEWDRDNFWWFKAGDKAYRIPKPFEIGAMASIAERGLEMVMDGMDEKSAKRFGKRLWNIVLDNLAMNPLPQLVKPAVDLYANTDSFTGRKIESLGMERLSKENRIGANTTATAQLLGKAGVLSPVQIDQAIQGYFGWLGTHAAMAADAVVRPALGLPDKPSRRLDDTFVIGDWVKQLPSNQSRFVEDFYKQAQDVREAVADLNNLKKMGNVDAAKAFVADNRDTLKKAPTFNLAEKQIGNINLRLRQIAASEKMLPEAKRVEIDRLSAIKLKLAERVTAK